MTVLLFQRLTARWWENALPQRILNDASEKVDTKCLFQENAREKGKSWQRTRPDFYSHKIYYPNGISREEIRPAYRETCGDTFQDLTTENGGRIQIKETTIAYSRPQNLRDLLILAKLCEGQVRRVLPFCRLKILRIFSNLQKSRNPLKIILFIIFIFFIRTPTVILVTFERNRNKWLKERKMTILNHLR